jgi:hypothetical protein
MQTRAELRNRTRHDVVLRGDNTSYVALGHFPTAALEKILPRDMSVPSPSVMAEHHPTLTPVDGRHPFVLMCSNCRNVHDVFTEITLRPYRELMAFIPVTYTQDGEQHLCSYVPVLYLEYLIGVVGGLYLGLRKQFRPSMRDEETATTKHFSIEGVLDARFEQQAAGTGELHPFFTEALAHPTLTRSYFGRTRLYTTTVTTSRVLEASASFTWHFMGSEIHSDETSVANYAEYQFTTSQAMGPHTYFHSRPRAGAPA